MKKATHLWRASLSVLLVLAMLLGTCGTVFTAGTDRKDIIEYVSLGDSMTNGYGLTNYDNNGYQTYGEEAYPNQFADWLVDAGYANSVLHTQLAMSAMRAEDLHFILEFPVDDANAIAVADSRQYDKEAWESTFAVGDRYTWNEFTDGRFKQNCVDTNTAAKVYQEAVAEADIISVGTGNANFGVFLMGRMMNAIGFGGDPSKDAWIEIERALNECDEETKAQVLELKAELDKLVAEEVAKLDNEKLSAIAAPMYNAMLYTAVSFVLNYAGSLERIMQLNPDAEVILVGIMNTFAGMDMTIEIDGKEEVIPLTDAYRAIVDPVNAFIAALPTAMQAANNSVYENGTFYYAECPEVECLVSTYEEALANDDSVVRDRFVEEIVDGMVWPMITPMFNQIDALKQMGLGLVPVTLEDIEAYESGNFDGVLTDSEVLSCAVYLAFEKAIVIGSKDSVLPMSSFESLANGFAGVFDGVGASLMGNLDFDAVTDEVTEKVTAAGTADVTAYVTESLQNDPTEFVTFCLQNGIAIDLSDPATIMAAAQTYGMQFYCYKNNIPDQNALVAKFTAQYAPYYTARVLGEDITPVLTDALTSDATLMGLLHLFGRMLIGNGLGAHPSVQGHNDLANAVIESYKNQYTCQDETIKNALWALEVLTELAKEYGPGMLEDAYNYAEEMGYIDQLEQAIAELKDQLLNASEELKAELEATIAELEAELARIKAEIEAELAALKAEIEAEIEALKAELEAAAEEAKAELEAAIEAKIAELEAKLAAAKAEAEAKIAAVKAEIEAKIAAAKAAVEAKIAAVKAEVEAKIAALEAELEAAVAALEAKAGDVYEYATKADFTVTEDTMLLSLGGSGAAGENAFIDRLAAEWGVEAINLANPGLRVEDLRAITEADADDSSCNVTQMNQTVADYHAYISQADLITVSVGKDNFTPFAMTQLSRTLQGKKPLEMNWAQYVTDDGVQYVDEAKAEAKTYLMEKAGLDASTADLLTLLVESYAFGYAGFAFNYAEMLNNIHALNPEALVVLVGSYNPIDDLVIAMDGQEIAIGEYVNYFVQLTDAHFFAYAAVTENTIFVQTHDVETVFDADVAAGEYGDDVAMQAYLLALLTDNGAAMFPSEAGHEYIKDEILNALNVTVEEPEAPVYDNGDINMDGIVNIQDAVQLYYYVNGKLELSDEALAIGDVAQPEGTVNIQDAVVLYYFVNGKVDTL